MPAAVRLDGTQTFVAASLVLLAGRQLVARLAPLRTFSIPEPVAGGVAAALLLLALDLGAGVSVRFDTSMQGPFMLAFFATIGLGADLRSLAAGGRMLVRFLAAVLAFLVAQNVVGVGMARLLGLDPRVGLLAGSIALSGGHGTAAAWGATFAREGVASAVELGLASATFGLVLGGVTGGPVAGWLLRHRDPAPGADAGSDAPPVGFEQPGAVRLITANALLEILALIAVCIWLGSLAAGALAGSPLALPVFVPVLLVGVALRNGLAWITGYEPFDRAVSVVGNASLALFLAMALMTLRLRELADLALPVLAILAVQTALVAAWVAWVTYPVMGRTYDAVVLGAGQCGFGLGGTPTAIANMQAITTRSGPSRMAFVIVPLVGAFFLDVANAVVIQLFLTVLR
ncbi:MAG TPA: sodium/glutamate symporter [Anaeromyxobacteraceae bacterium]|nr:sodium/glutamate symporter [Anaeromyxobacteraceae bacterium]